MIKMDLAYWKGTLQNFLNADVQTKFTKKMIHHARKRIASIESKVLVCCVLLVVSCAGCFENTGQSIGQSIKAISNTGNAFWTDVADGLIDMNTD